MTIGYDVWFPRATVLPSFVEPQEFQELIPSHEPSIDDDAFGVDATADTFERHFDRRTALNEKALAESLANFAP